MIPYGRQNISQTDIDAVIDVLTSDWITQGPAIERFERSIIEHTHAAHAVAVSSATAALHLACLALELGDGDILWTSPNSFVASANCALYCGASVDFVDIDPRSCNMSVAALRDKLEHAREHNRLPAIVVPVHFAGESCDMRAIHELSKEYGFHIIEDASHAIGARYLDHAVGDCRYSDICVFSFHPVKIITTGEGGALTTKDTELADRLRRLRSHGITRDTQLFPDTSDGPWDYRQIETGYNYRITDLQCALGASQMQRLEAFIDKRHALADRYDELLDELPVITPRRDTASHSALHLYPVRLQQDDASIRAQVFQQLREAGIGVNVHYRPIHTQPVYRDMGFSEGDFPQAEAWYRNCISLPMYFDLSEAQQDEIVTALQAALR